MSRHVNSISGRLSLRTPQRQSLEILHRVMEIAQLHKNRDLQAALSVIRSEFASVEDFERAFRSPPLWGCAISMTRSRISRDLRCGVRRERRPLTLLT